MCTLGERVGLQIFQIKGCFCQKGRGKGGVQGHSLIQASPFYDTNPGGHSTLKLGGGVRRKALNLGSKEQTFGKNRS